MEFCKNRNQQKGTYNTPPLNMERSIAIDYHELACVFNEYFIKATNNTWTDKQNETSLAMVDLQQPECKKLFPQIALVPVTAREIKDTIKSLKWRNSSGYDEIPPRLLKLSTPYIVSPLVYLCNRSLATGIFPT